jgi:hypothetical protein
VKRIVLAAVAATLLVGPAAHAATKRLPLCLTITDAPGDSGFASTVTQLGDPSLDITKVKIATVGTSLVSTITVQQMAERPTASLGGNYEVRFSVAGKNVRIYYKAGPYRDTEENAFYQQGVWVNSEHMDAIPVKAGVKGNVVTIAITLKSLKSAVGSRVDGEEADAVGASASNTYVASSSRWDDATTDSVFVVGRACR